MSLQIIEKPKPSANTLTKKKNNNISRISYIMYNVYSLYRIHCTG